MHPSWTGGMQHSSCSWQRNMCCCWKLPSQRVGILIRSCIPHEPLGPGPRTVVVCAPLLCAMPVTAAVLVLCDCTLRQYLREGAAPSQLVVILTTCHKARNFILLAADECCCCRITWHVVTQPSAVLARTCVVARSCKASGVESCLPSVMRSCVLVAAEGLLLMAAELACCAADFKQCG